MPQADTDTIVAIATAPGAGGVGVVRLSGPRSRAIAETICVQALAPRHAHYARFRDGHGDTIDDGIALHFAAPASYTGEDVVELQAHGSPVVLQQLVARCCELGARMARPGEFSERAFLNGKLDLAQAEAVADLIAAGDARAARAARRALDGVFSRRSRRWPRNCWRCACTSRRRSTSPTNRSTPSAARSCGSGLPRPMPRSPRCCCRPSAGRSCATACTW